jgi:hypothetical protein
MIDKDWRRRFMVLSERLETAPFPASECSFALEKFKEIKNPVPMVQSEHASEIRYEVPVNGPDLNDLATQAIEKGLDLGIMAEILLKK